MDPVIDPALHPVVQPPSSRLAPLNTSNPLSQNGSAIVTARDAPLTGVPIFPENTIQAGTANDLNSDAIRQHDAAAALDQASQIQDPSPRKIASHPSQVSTSSRDAVEYTFVDHARPWAANAQKAMEMSEGNLPSQKDAVRALRKYTTLTNAEIFRRVGVSTSGGYRHLRGEPDKEPGEKHKETRGRKRKLDEEVVKKIIHEIETQPGGEKTKSWEELCKQAGVTGIAPVTLKRAVENAGYYKCSHCQRVTKAHGMGKENKDGKDKEGKDPKDPKEPTENRAMQQDNLTEDWGRRHLGF